MAMVADAISHAILPGIVLTYLVFDSKDSFLMLIGAGVFGFFTAFLIEWIHSRLRLQEDASIGISFTFLFSIGVILISYYASNIDLDMDCVLYGEITYVPLNTVTLQNGLNLGPKALWTSGAMFLLVVSFVSLFYKELRICTFDPSYAVSIGIATVIWHYALMGLLSFTTVICFESVGSVLVVTFFIVPPATAYLITNKLNHMIILSVLSGIVASVGGYFLANLLNASIAAGMCTTCGIEFLLAFLLKRQKR